jgi:exosortase family protein XrtF
MKALYTQFSSIINFLMIFMLTFFLLSMLYDLYLQRYENKVDGMSSVVGSQAANLLGLLGYNAFATNQHAEKSTHVGIDSFARVKVIEGCNGLSVMILFLAFLIGFPGSLKHKAWFIAAGLLVIHWFNIIRVSVLCWAVYSFGETGYPVYKEMFTASIYVLVLGLWYLWVQKYGFTQVKKP